MKIERIERIYSQGTAERREDGDFANPPYSPYLGVVDGVSAPYSPSRPPILFDGMTGGEMTKKVLLETFYAAKSNLTLGNVILQANQKIRKFQTARGIPIERSDRLAGAAFVFSKMGEEKVEIIQGADCLAIWATSSGVGATENQSYLYEKEGLRIVAHLMKKHKGNRKQMWIDYYPFFCENKLRNSNRKTKTGFAILNGQPWVSECWQRVEVPLKDLELLLLLSDGFIPLEETKDEKVLAKRMVTLYRQNGLGGILEKTRKIEERQRHRKHIDHAEATAIAIEFVKSPL